MIRRLRALFGAAKRRVLPSGDLAQQTAKSGVWAMAMNALTRGLTLLMMIIMARLLSPEAFGIYGFAMLTIAGVTEFTTTGVTEALIQHEEEDVDEFLNTAWTIQFVRGIGVTLILVGLAPFVAAFFQEPVVTDFLRFMAIATLIAGLHNPAVVYFRKSLNFHKQFLYRASGTVMQFAVGVGLAYAWESVWAFAVAYVAVELTRTPVSYLAHDYRPRPEFHVDYARDMIGYGKWITGSSILYYLWNQGDDVIVGWLLSTAALGWYRLGYRLSNAPATEVSKVVSNVMFPTFSKLQDEPAALRDAFFRTIQITALVAFPMAFGIVAVAPSFVRGFLGTDWLPMVPVLQLLALFGLLGTVATPGGTVFRAVGRPDYATKMQALRVASMAVLIVPATMAYGIVGTALVVVGVFVFPVFPVEFYLLVQVLDTTYRRLLIELGYPIVASTTMLLTVLAVRTALSGAPAVLTFVLLVLAGIVSYTVAVAVLVTGLDWDVDRNLRWIIRNAAG